MYHLIDYVWCVEKFAQYFEPAHDQDYVYPLLTSPIFAYKNTRWVLNLYPEGLGDSASHGYISLFIKYVSEDPETINAKVELSLLNNKNERVYCRDTGDHQYQTFIDFGYKQFLKMQDIKEQKDELISYNGLLKIFARVEFEHATLPTSLTWSNYDLLLFKENFKDLYETKNLCDILVRVIKQPIQQQQQQAQLLPGSSNQLVYNNTQQPQSICINTNQRNNHQSKLQLFHPYQASTSNGFNKVKKQQQQQQSCSCSDCNTGVINLFNSVNYLSTINNNNNNEIVNETLEIKSHKFILASRSGKFRELLKTNLIKLVNSTSILNNDQNQINYCNKCFKRIFISTKTSPATNDEIISTSSFQASSSSSSSSSSCNNNNNNSVESTDSNSYCKCNSNELSIYDNNNENDESITDMLIIETDRNPKVIEYLIRYMYTGYLDSLDMFAKDIYEISKEYKVHGLTNLAREHIIKELNIQNCCDYLVFCVVNNDYELNNKIQAFIAENYETITKTSAYKQAKRKYRELFENLSKSFSCKNEIFKKIPAFNR